MRSLLNCTLVLFLVLAGAAQNGPARSSGQIEIEVAAIDNAGRLNTQLKQSDFNLYFGGVRQNITEFEAPGDGSHVLLLFDHNDTWLIGDTPTNSKVLWNQMQRGISSFMNSLQPKDRLQIASFENTVTTILPWRIMRSGSAVTANLSAITAPARSGKNMYGALIWAVGQFAGAKGRKVVIVFTDGRDARLTPRWFQSEDGREILDPLAGLVDDGEAEDFKRTVETLRNSNVQVYFVAPYPDRNARFVGPSGSDYSLNGISGNSSLSDAYLKQVRARFEQLSKATSGAVFFAEQPAEAPALYANLPNALKLSASYHLVFSPSERSSQAQLIEVKIRNGEFRAAQSRTTN